MPTRANSWSRAGTRDRRRRGCCGRGGRRGCCGCCGGGGRRLSRSRRQLIRCRCLAVTAWAGWERAANSGIIIAVIPPTCLIR